MNPRYQRRWISTDSDEFVIPTVINYNMVTGDITFFAIEGYIRERKHTFKNKRLTNRMKQFAINLEGREIDREHLREDFIAEQLELHRRSKHAV